MSPKFWNLKYTQLTSFPVNIEVISTRILTTEQKHKKCKILWYFFKTIQHTGNILCIQFSMVRVNISSRKHKLNEESSYLRWFSSVTPVFSTNETDCHYITEICLKVALNNHNPNPLINEGNCQVICWHCMLLFKEYT